jgi:hypothetical protein
MSPESYDVVITDIQSADMDHIGIELGHANLARVQGEEDGDGRFPVLGTFYGNNLRLFVALTVRKQLKGSSGSVWVVFLLDTGSPFTFLGRDTMDAMGFGENVPKTAQVSVHGVSLPVSLSHGHFENINVLGQNFMKAAQLNLRVDYLSGEVTLAKA